VSQVPRSRKPKVPKDEYLFEDGKNLFGFFAPPPPTKEEILRARLQTEYEENALSYLKVFVFISTKDKHY
jgi:hypothetical protein